MCFHFLPFGPLGIWFPRASRGSGPASQVICSRVSFFPVLYAAGAQVKGHTVFSDGFRSEGEVSLLAAKVDGDLDCHGGRLTRALFLGDCRHYAADRQDCEGK